MVQVHHQQAPRVGGGARPVKKLTQYDRAVLEFARMWNACETCDDVIRTFMVLGADVAWRFADLLRTFGVDLRHIYRPMPNVKYVNRMLAAPKKPRRVKKTRRTK